MGTVISNTARIIPTVTDMLFGECQSPANLIGVFFEPTNSLEAPNGELTFGGIDMNGHNTPVFVPVSECTAYLCYQLVNQA